jgi:DNA-binding GntR family transcriptional regulator
MEMRKVPHKTLGEKVYQILKERIIRWELEPGERLKDREIAAALGVSPSLVRNAFVPLEKEDLITISRKGVYVTELTRKLVKEIFEVRILIESYALESAFDKITQKDLEDLEERIGQAERELEAGRLEACFDLDIVLHQLSINRCANSVIKKIFSNFRNMFGIIRRSDRGRVANVAKSFGEHRRIFEAIKRRDLENAKKNLAFHLSDAMNRVLENF